MFECRTEGRRWSLVDWAEKVVSSIEVLYREQMSLTERRGQSSR